MEIQCPDCYKARNRDILQSQTEISCVVLGTQGVGKSSMIKNFMLYLSRQHLWSKGLDIHIEFIELHATLLPETKRMIIEESDAFLLLYAVDNRKSFDYMSDLRDKILAIKGDSTPIVIVGNKADLELREVHYALADCIVTMDWGYPYVECSTNKLDSTALHKLSKQVLSHPRLTVKHEATSKSNYATGIHLQSNILSESTKSDQSKIKKYLSFSFKSIVKTLGLHI